MPRFYFPAALESGLQFDLPTTAVRHVQVLRLQPGEVITLFNSGLEFEARIDQITRQSVKVTALSRLALSREANREVHLALGIPGNERMDWLVEKATELGVASIQPLLTHRSVVKLDGARALKRIAHWQAIAISACEQCGRNQIPVIQTVLAFSDWIKGFHNSAGLLLSLSPDNVDFQELITGLKAQPVWILSGPEGGLTDQEELSGRTAGFRAVSLGPRILRAETAPLAVLSALTLLG